MVNKVIALAKLFPSSLNRSFLSFNLLLYVYLLLATFFAREVKDIIELMEGSKELLYFVKDETIDNISVNLFFALGNIYLL